MPANPGSGPGQAPASRRRPAKAGVTIFCGFIKSDDDVKSPPSRHTGESRYPELSRKTGFRVKHGMTKKGKIDFLRSRQDWSVRREAADPSALLSSITVPPAYHASARLRYSLHLASTDRWSLPNCSRLIFLKRPCRSTKWITGARFPFSARVLLRPVKRNFPFSIS